ncbi:M20/M25/M40 family metallo-hydrolase [Nocardioides pantholopis]|uniref:M20/M25/M40 family metallo-hydrolase n=1 Tax=Nocardioides pantholopis TaxID=2483798 RepID=UPI000F080583|nr:M20/M25/M40 family metallo-hydrolase [Nocardioides pantholopis]
MTSSERAGRRTAGGPGRPRPEPSDGQPRGTGRTPVDAAVTDAALALVRTPSPSRQEALAACLFVEIAREWGLEAFIDDAGNAQAWTAADPTGSPTVLLLGHIDTVPGGPSASLADGVLHGRGSVDAKGPLVAMLAAAARYAAQRRPDGLRVGVVGAVEEETPCSRGAMWIREHLPPPDAVVIGEPSGWDAITLGYKGKLDLEYAVRTPARHPAHPGPQASEDMLTFCARVLDLYGTAGNSSFKKVSLAVTSLHGDCHAARCSLSFRTPPGLGVADLVSWVEDQSAGGEVSVINAVDAVRVRRNDPVVSALSAAIARADGRSRHQVKTGTSDMNTLAEVWQVPMATYGPGDAALDHSDEEQLQVRELLSSTRVLHDALTILETRLPR